MALRDKLDALEKASGRNNEVTYMLQWLERQHDKLTKQHEATKESLAAQRAAATQKGAELAQLRALLASKQIRGAAVSQKPRRR
jgi:hypothetical protein